ncbi:unnamed protein product, partial [Oikopleura dioica]
MTVQTLMAPEPHFKPGLQKWNFMFTEKPFQIRKMDVLKVRLFQILLRLDIQVGSSTPNF